MLLTHLQSTGDAVTADAVYADDHVLQAQVLIDKLAAVVAAEAASSSSDYTLLTDMNAMTQRRYADMTSFVRGLQPQTEVT